MPGAAPDPFDFGSLRRGAFTYFPVAPGRLEFAAEVRRKILTERPRVVAVELPENIERAFLSAIDRLPEISAVVYPDPAAGDESIYLVVEPCDPFVEAIRTAREAGAEVLFIDPAIGERPHLPDDYPDPYAIRYLGLDRYIEQYRLEPQPRNDETAAYAGRIAWKLQGADPFAPTIVVLSLNLLDPVLDAMQEPQPTPGRRLRNTTVDLVNAHPECLAEVCMETPFQNERYTEWRSSLTPTGFEHPAANQAPGFSPGTPQVNPAPNLIDRPRTQLALLKQAELAYEASTGDKMVHWQRRLLARYSRNLAHVSGYLTASLFELTLAARGIVDDNFAWEVWHRANQYGPQQDSVPTFETLNLSASEIWLNTRKLKIRRRLPRPKQRLKPATLKSRKKESQAGDWARSTDGNSICSYPPEDLAIEAYGRFLKSKAKSILTGERDRVQPFTTSLLDGIDVRETVRNWHQRKIYVKEIQRASGDFGSLVVIFDEDRDERYGYLTTWLGEHQNESDMAYYSTQPFEHMVGPGIGRAEYGGFLMTLPAGRLYDVWADPDYEAAESNSERLLLAALDYAVERNVIYVAPKPPRSIFRSIAAQLNRKIVYIPIGQLNSEQLKKVRVVHVLDGHARRDETKGYLW